MRLDYILPLLLVFTACGTKKKLDDATQDVKELKTVTSEANANIETFNGLAEDGIVVAAQGIGSPVRDELIEDLLRAQTIEEKVLYAAKYFYAFEFQVLRPGRNVRSSVALREQLKAEAATEFGRILYRFQRQLREGKATNQDNVSKSLYALAATVERHNPLQPTLLGSSGVPVASMMDILHGSLAKSQRLNSGRIGRGDLSAVDREVLREEQQFTKFLQIRSKLLPVLALGLSSNISQGLWPQLNMRFRKWTPRFVGNSEGVTGDRELNVEQIAFAGDILETRAREQRVMETLRAAVPLDGDIRAIWRNMDLAPLRTRVEADARKNAAVSTGLDRFEGLVQGLLE